MRKIAAVVVAVLLCLSVSFAHPGRTDSNGGHYNREDGSYHYHHGYPAHQHTNNSCPYGFVDKTGEKSGTPSYSSRKPPVLPQNEKPEKVPNRFFEILGIAFMVLFSVVAFLPPLITFLLWLFDTLKSLIDKLKKHL